MKNDMRIGELFNVLIIAVLLLLPACGGNGNPQNNYDTPPSYTVSGTVTASKNIFFSGVVIQNNGRDDLAIAADSTSFTFPTAIADGEGYNVTIKAQPNMHTCLVTQGSGTISGAYVTNVRVECGSPWSIN